ncbi:MAG: signal peptidase II [Firmicutes bacterium]|nr:signal peptidase II [Bacillota bacterium]
MFFYVIICLVVGVDQLTKGLIQRALVLHQSLTVVPGFLALTRINNPGAAFGILQHKTILLVVAPLLFFSLVFFFRKEILEYPMAFRLGLAFCLGGAAGNLIDRIRNGGQVIDFIDLEFWPLQNFPVFNLADSAIFIGVLLMVYCLCRYENKY